MNFQIHFDIPIYIFLLFGVTSAGLSYLMYRRLEIVSSSRRVFLGILRSASFFLLFLAMTNLVTDFVRFESKKKEALLLVDDSRSMSLSDSSVSRAKIVRDILKSPEFEKLGTYFDIKPLVFGGRVLEKANVDSLAFDQAETNIDAAVARASQLSGTERTAFALLISDGDYNIGGNPVEAAGNLTFPVYTVGVGDSTQPKDIIVRQIIPAPAIYAGKKSVVRAIIGSHGFGGAYVTARLLEDGKLVDSKNVTLPQNGSVEVSFGYTPSVVGTHLLEVYVPPLSGEFSRRNNSASASVRVQKGKYSILLVAGEPAADVAFLRRNIQSSGDFELRELVQKTTGTFYQQDAAEILSRKYDAVILYDFPNGQSSTTLQEVNRILKSSEEPYVYFAGKEFSARKVVGLPRLPFVPTGFQTGEFQVGVAMTGSAALPPALQPLYTLLDGNSALFPPVYYQRIPNRPSAGAVALAYPVLNGVRLNEPLLLADPARRSAALLAYGVWRLQLMSSISGLRSDFLQDFLTTLIRTLITGGKEKMLAVHTDKKVYDPSEAVNFNALLVGQGGAPRDNATVEVTVRNRQGSAVDDIMLSGTGAGGYSGIVSGLGRGRYSYSAKASAGSTFLGADSGMIVVEPLNTEFVQTAMNASLLRQIASVSGGKFMTASQFLRQGMDIKQAWRMPIKTSLSRKFELLSSMPILALVFILLAAEWTMRKIWGLP